ncbi:hypothetical protein SAMN05421853_12319 [Roseivivax halotolerans]|uniref:Uncharacterized protein n=1 Tax=Roseivivax halotolerans TaxID=93684 RepID=A0A1I6AKM9_9RHOB|nr:hypothetical protein [Roseivivax halotolerans]SFQ69239.1 hypothetical protein SAMN05421853_12319 [Roseivivax halotolerans]
MTLTELKMRHAHMLSRYNSGIEIGPGWIDLVDRLLKDLDALQVGIEVTQIKSKYATLSCYLAAYSDTAIEIVDRYEELSAHTCERCGKPGEIRRRGWLETLCDDCA